MNAWMNAYMARLGVKGMPGSFMATVAAIKICIHTVEKRSTELVSTLIFGGP